MKTMERGNSIIVKGLVAIVMFMMSVGVSIAQESNIKYSGTSSGTGRYVNNRQKGCATSITDNTSTVATSVGWEISNDGVLTIKKGKGAEVDIVMADGTKEKVTVFPMPNYDTYTLPEWYQYATEIKKVVIEDGITSVGSYSIYLRFSNLTEVQLPESIEWMGTCCIRGCGKLQNMHIPDNVYAIGIWAFSGNTTWTSLTFPKNLKRIESAVLSGCSKLTSVTIQEGVTAICSSYPFNSTKITTIKLPSTLKTIGERAFLNCTSLTSIEIPENVTTISDNPFYNCNNVSITVNPKNTTFVADDNVIYTKDKSEIVVYSKKKTETEFKVSNSVKTIRKWAFVNCDKLTSVTIPEGLVKIDEQAFFGCSALGKVKLPASMTDLMYGAFSNCMNIKLSVDENNKQYVVEDGVVFLKGAGGRTLVFYPSSKDDEYYEVPSDVTVVRNRAFGYNKYLQNVDFSKTENLSSLGRSSFEYCSQLSSIVIPNSVTILGTYLFDNCKKLTSVVLPNNNAITSIGERMFQYCESLTDIQIPTHVTSLGYQSFLSCKSLTNIELSDNVKAIETDAFNNCQKLESIVVPDAVTIIKYGTFSNCKALKSVVLGSKVTSFGYYAFKNCPSLVSVSMKNPVPPSITCDVFEGINVDARLYVPCNAQKDYSEKEYYSRFFTIDDIENKVFVKVTVATNNDDWGSAVVTTEPDCGQNPQIDATPAEGCTFTHWSSHGKEDVAEQSFKFGEQITEDVLWTANFERLIYYVTNITDSEENGTVTASINSGYFKDPVTLVVEPFKGYELDELKVTRKDNDMSVEVASDMTFEMPSSDVNVEATFKKSDYKIEIEEVEHGKVTAQKTANYKEKVKLTVVPDEDYQLASVSITGVVDGAEYNEKESEFSMPANDVKVTPTFVAIDYTVPVGGTFVVGDFKYKVTSLEPNVVSVSAKDDEVSGDLIILDNVTYNKITYVVSSIAEEGFAGASQIESVMINRTTPMTLGANAFYSTTRIKVPCGYQKVYVDYGYTKSSLENISDYEYKVSVTTDGNGSAEILSQADCDNHYAKVKATDTKPGYSFAKWSDGSKDRVHEVLVDEDVELKASFSANDYEVNVTEPTNGSFTVSASVANVNDVITVYPVPATGYKLSAITVKDAIGNSVEVAANNTFKMPASNVEVSVTFVAVDYKVEVGKITNGTVSVAKNTFHYKESVTLTVKPTIGYELQSLIVKDASSNNIELDGNVFTMPASDVTVSATFKKSAYNVTVGETANGSVAVNKNTALYQDDIVITATPEDAHYSVAAIEVKDKDGNVIATSDSFKMPASDVTVNVTFAKTQEIVDGDTFRVGDFVYTVKSVQLNMVTVGTDKTDIGEKIIIEKTVTYNGHTFNILQVTNDGFSNCANLKEVQLKSDGVLKLGDNAFAGDNLTLYVPCSTRDKFVVAANYSKYFSEVIEWYDGPTLSVKSENVNMGTAEVAQQQDCGQIAIAVATPHTGYGFKEWSDGSKEQNYKMASLSADMTLVAKFEIINYKITVNVTSNKSDVSTGEVSIKNVAENYHYKDDIELILTPSEGYSLNTVSVLTKSGESVPYSDGHFSMPASDVTINVDFKAIDYAINIPENLVGGEIDVVSIGHVGERIRVEAKPNAGYKVDEALTVKTLDRTLDITNGQFTMPASAVNVSVSFKAIPYNITYEEVAGGTIAVQSTGVVGEIITVNVVPDEGYEIDQPLKVVSGQTEVKVTENAFVMPAGNVSLTATFKEVVVTELIGSGNSDDHLFKAYGANKAIEITVDKADKVVIYNVLGQAIWSKANAQGSYSVEAIQGIYIVSNGVKTIKVIVK